MAQRGLRQVDRRAVFKSVAGMCVANQLGSRQVLTLNVRLRRIISSTPPQRHRSIYPSQLFSGSTVLRVNLERLIHILDGEHRRSPDSHCARA
jgi:hypothetical protein